MVWEMCCITHITVWKLDINTYVNNVFERDNCELVLVWLVETDNVAYWASQTIMAFAYMLTRHWHRSNDSPTSHSWIISDRKECFNVPITYTVSLLVSNGAMFLLETLLYSRQRRRIRSLWRNNEITCTNQNQFLALAILRYWTEAR